MTEMSFYQTQPDELIKTFCQVSEKCYYNNSRALVIEENQDNAHNLDKALWTYSKKHFIPHSTNSDPYPEKQHILISTETKNLNNANTIIIINPTIQLVLRILSHTSSISLKQITKMIFLHNHNITNIKAIKGIVNKSTLKVSQTNYFTKQTHGVWQNISHIFDKM